MSEEVKDLTPKKQEKTKGVEKRAEAIINRVAMLDDQSTQELLQRVQARLQQEGVA